MLARVFSVGVGAMHVYQTCLIVGAFVRGNTDNSVVVCLSRIQIPEVIVVDESTKRCDSMRKLTC